MYRIDLYLVYYDGTNPIGGLKHGEIGLVSFYLEFDTNEKVHFTWFFFQWKKPAEGQKSDLLTYKLQWFNHIQVVALKMKIFCHISATRKLKLKHDKMMNVISNSYSWNFKKGSQNVRQNCIVR